MDIYPVKTESDYTQALSDIESLWGSPEGTEEGDKLDILVTLVESYESTHHAINPPDPIDAIKFRMEQESLTRKDLELCIGSRGRVSEVMNGRRSLSLNMIRKLHSKLHIPLESLIREAKTT